MNISNRGLKMNRGDIYKGNDRYTEKEMRAIIKSMIDDPLVITLYLMKHYIQRI